MINTILLPLWPWQFYFVAVEYAYLQVIQDSQSFSREKYARRFVVYLNGKIIFYPCSILLFSENVTMEFSGQDNPVFKGTKNGKIYLTTHRMIYNAKNYNDSLQSFSFPFICLQDVSEKLFQTPPFKHWQS